MDRAEREALKLIDTLGMEGALDEASIRIIRAPNETHQKLWEEILDALLLLDLVGRE